MAFLACVVALVGMVTLLNLVLILGIVRRLRDHTERLAGLSYTGEQRSIMAVGDRPSDFIAETVDGQKISRDSLPAGALVAFLQPNCEPCREETPDFLNRAAAAPGGRESVLAVVVQGRTGTAEYVERLEGVARVVIEPSSGPIASAFGVRAFPAFAELAEDGTVTTTGHRVSRMAMFRRVTTAR